MLRDFYFSARLIGLERCEWDGTWEVSVLGFATGYCDSSLLRFGRSWSGKYFVHLLWGAVEVWWGKVGRGLDEGVF